jgi:predicted DNA binding CopG/RHH family protein
VNNSTSNVSLKPIPQFLSEEEECEFWLKADTSDYFAPEPDVNFETPNQMPLTLKFDTRLVMMIKRLASAEGIPYECLIQRWLWECAHDEIFQRHEKTKAKQAEKPS